MGLGEPPGTGTVGGPGSRTLNHAQLENQISISLINIIRLIVFLGQPPGTVSGPGSRTLYHAQRLRPLRQEGGGPAPEHGVTTHEV